MTLLELNSRVAKIVADAETQLREVLLAAGAEIQKVEKDGETAKPVVLKLASDVEAIVDASKSVISINGNPVQKVEELLTLVNVIQPKLGDLRVDVIAALPVVEAAVADVAALEKTVVDGVEHLVSEVKADLA